MAPPPPSQGVGTDVAPPDDSGEVITVRQQLEASHSRLECQSCHALIDGIGFAFEHYDALGRYRNQDNGAPVDARPP